MRRRAAVSGLAALVVALALSAWAAPGDGSSPRVGPVPSRDGAPGAAVTSRLFTAGSAVDGLPLTATLARDDTGSVSFVYGDCAAGDDAGCAPPVEIQVWPACRRHLALYRLDGRSPVPEPATVRGAPAGSFDGGTRLELQTGDATVVVFGDSSARVSRVAAALASVDGSVRPGRPLPAPVPGAVEGGLDC